MLKARSAIAPRGNPDNTDAGVGVELLVARPLYSGRPPAELGEDKFAAAVVIPPQETNGNGTLIQ